MHSLTYFRTKEERSETREKMKLLKNGTKWYACQTVRRYGQKPVSQVFELWPGKKATDDIITLEKDIDRMSDPWGKWCRKRFLL